MLHWTWMGAVRWLLIICVYATSALAQLEKVPSMHCPTAFHSLGLGAAQIEPFWIRQIADYQENTAKVLRNEGSLFRSQFERGDPYVKFLEGLGFDFREGAPLPSLPDVLAKLDLKQAEIEASGMETLGMREWITSTNPPKKAGGPRSISVKVLPWGSPVSHLDDPRISSAADIGRYFTKHLSQGYFPGGPHEFGLVGGRTTNFLHNLGHMMTIQEHPKETDLIIKKIRGLRERIANGSSKKVDASSPLMARIFLVMETLTVVPATNKQALMGLMQLPKNIADPTEKEILQYLKSLRREQLEALVKNLDEDVPRLVERIGGGLAEPTTFDAAMKQGGTPERIVEQSTFDSRYLSIRKMADKLKIGKLNWEEAHVLEDSLRDISRYQRRMLDLSSFDAGRWIDDLLVEGDGVAKDSPIYKMFCLNDDSRTIEVFMSLAICGG